MMGLPDGPKSFKIVKIGLVFKIGFDTIPAVTDTQPTSHVAVAITLYAKASSLIKRHVDQ